MLVPSPCSTCKPAAMCSKFARLEFGFRLRSVAEWVALYRQAGFGIVDAQNVESEQITPDGTPTKRYAIRVTARR